MPTLRRICDTWYCICGKDAIWHDLRITVINSNIGWLPSATFERYIWPHVGIYTCLTNEEAERLVLRLYGRAIPKKTCRILLSTQPLPSIVGGSDVPEADGKDNGVVAAYIWDKTSSMMVSRRACRTGVFDLIRCISLEGAQPTGPGQGVIRYIPVMIGPHWKI